MSDGRLIKDTCLMKIQIDVDGGRRSLKCGTGSDGLVIPTRESWEKRVILINLSEMAHELSLY